LANIKNVFANFSPIPMALVTCLIRMGGEMAMPGAPGDPLQVIDVRDLTEWLILLSEEGTTEVFDAKSDEQRMAVLERIPVAGEAEMLEEARVLKND
jgi:hypothetical protein